MRQTCNSKKYNVTSHFAKSKKYNEFDQCHTLEKYFFRQKEYETDVRLDLLRQTPSCTNK